MKDRLKIVRNRDRNVPRVHGHKCLDDDVCLASLSLQESECACSMRRGAVLLKHKKNVCGQPVNVWQWPLSKKVVATVCHLHYDTKSDCNKSNVK